MQSHHGAHWRRVRGSRAVWTLAPEPPAPSSHVLVHARLRVGAAVKSGWELAARLIRYMKRAGFDPPRAGRGR